LTPSEFEKFDSTVCKVLAVSAGRVAGARNIETQARAKSGLRLRDKWTHVKPGWQEVFFRLTSQFGGGSRVLGVQSPDSHNCTDLWVMSPLMAERTYKSRELQPRKHCI
jgi:hypothetical protein